MQLTRMRNSYFKKFLVNLSSHGTLNDPIILGGLSVSATCFLTLNLKSGTTLELNFTFPIELVLGPKSLNINRDGTER
jgi:hypothetical protein